MKPTPSSAAVAGGGAPGPDFPVWKKILFSIVIVALFFGATEGILRIAGVRSVMVDEDPFVGFAGNVPLFVVTEDSAGAEIMATAANKRLFNRQSFPARKDPNAYRIFCLGGSTTFGRPYDDNSSFAGWLRELLPAAAPSVTWEVINAGGVSYASYRVARLMQELVRYQPDLFIVYTGQNEFLEERTYRGIKAAPGIVSSTSAVLVRTRTWAAVSALLERVGVTSTAPASDGAELADEVDTLLEHFGPEVYERDDSLREQIRTHYRVSLERMVRIAADAGAGLVFVKPSSNVKDCSPFKSQHTDGLSPAVAQRSEELGRTAATALARGDWQAALTTLDQAVAIDSRYAEHHYRRGKALVELGRPQEAGAAFVKALEEDVCPLRAVPIMLQDLAEVATEHHIPLVDFNGLIETLAQTETGIGVVGQEYFLDHVHPTIRANGLLGFELADVVLAAVGLPTSGLTDSLLAEAGSRIESRLDPSKRARSLANLAGVLAWSGKLEDAVRPAHQALEYDDDDPMTVSIAAGVLATWYAAVGDIERERFFYRLTLNASPGNCDTHWRIGMRALDRDPPEVELACAHILNAAVYWQGEKRDAPHRVLGGVLASRGLERAAFSHLIEANLIDPDEPETRELLNQVGSRLGPVARTLQPPKFSVEKYASGAVRTIVQVKMKSDGQYVADGIWTEWHEGGEPSRFREMSDGALWGVDVKWDAAGRELSRSGR